MPNIELNYSSLNSFVSRLKAIDNQYGEACTQLGKSLDWGSKACQFVWSFRGKDEAFLSIAKANAKMKTLKNECNPDLIRFINTIDDLYEGTKSGQNNALSWLKKMFKYGWIVPAVINPHIITTVLFLWSGGKIVSWIKGNSKPNIPATPAASTTIGITPIAINNPSKSGTASTVTTATTTQNIVTSGQVLSDIWQKWSAYSPNGFTNINGKGNCTWYADNRWSQMNPDNPLRFTRTTNRDAGYWDDAIDRNYFDVNVINNDTIRGNAIAVRDQGGSYTHGHVAYIEQVKDGMVYYTEDGEVSTRPATWAKNADGSWQGPTVQCCTVAEFQRKFNKIITSK